MGLPLAHPSVFTRFAEDGLRQDTKIHGYFGWFEGTRIYAMVRQEREFRIAELTRFEVSLNEPANHRRKLLRTEREQRRRRRTSGRFSKCELSL